MKSGFKFNLTISFFLFLILSSSIASSSTVETVPLVTKETQIPVHQSWKADLAIYGDKIVWMDLEHKYNIFTYDLATSKETNLTNNPTTYGFGYDNGFCIYKDKIVLQDLYGETIFIYNVSTQLESKIADESSGKRHPAVYGNNIIWEDDRNGKMNYEYDLVEGEDIYMYNFSTQQEIQITNSGLATNPAIFEDRIVWSDNRSGNEGDIYLYNISTSQETQITSTGRADYAEIYGDRIVWQDNRSGNLDIYMYDLSTKKESQITNDKSDQYDPAIYGNIIVWDDERNGGWYYSDIYMYNILTSKEIPITSNNLCDDSPAIYGNRIVWMVRHYDDKATADIYMTNIDSDLSAASLSSSPTSEATSLNNTSGLKSTTYELPKRVYDLCKRAYVLTGGFVEIFTIVVGIFTILGSIVTLLPIFRRFFPLRSNNKPTIKYFDVSPLTIVSGGSTVLTWDVSDATDVIITPGVGKLGELTGSISVSPTRNTTYTLTAINKAGENIVTKNVIVDDNSSTVLYVETK